MAVPELFFAGSSIEAIGSNDAAAWFLNVLEIAAQELLDGEGHELFLVSAHMECDFVVFYLGDTARGYRAAAQVAGHVGEDSLAMAIFLTDMHVPLFPPCSFDDFAYFGIGEMVWEVQLFFIESLGDGFKYFSAKEDSGHGEWEEVIVAQVEPSAVFKSASGDQAMDVGMEDEGFAPGV